MKRSPINSDPDKVRAWQQRSRKRLPAQSAKRQQEAKSNADIREQTFERDGWTCRLAGFTQLGPCMGPLTFHHKQKASAGGGYTVDNGITLCAQHNSAIEDFPLLARQLGMVKRSWD
jgi:hypothetical protein